MIRTIRRTAVTPAPSEGFPVSTFGTACLSAIPTICLRAKGRWLGGWQTFGIWSFQTGRPFTVALLPDLDNSNTGRSMLGFGANDRPNVLRQPGSLRALRRNGGLTRPPSQSRPTAPSATRDATSSRGRGYQNISVSLIKNTKLKEGVALQFRAEAFNLLNHANLDLPDIFVGSPTFGRISSAQNPRRVQFGIKLLY